MSCMSKPSRSTGIFTLSAMLSLLAISAAHGMGADYPEGAIASKEGWPEGLASLINSHPRASAYWVNANDFFQYAGDAGAINSILSGLAVIGERSGWSVQLIIHPGPGRTGNLGDREPTRPMDWAIEVIQPGWDVESILEPKVAGAKPILRVRAYTGGKLDLKALKVPATIAVKAGSTQEISNFVLSLGYEREAERRKAAAKAKESQGAGKAVGDGR